MSSVNSVRIPGLATGMDTDQMIKDMLTGEQSRVDKAKQKEQTTKWQQEMYRDTIKDVKGLYDKYFSATSKDFILSSKTFSTITATSSNNKVITATANAGATDINYNFKVTSVAQPPRISSTSANLDKTKTLKDLGIVGINEKITITINDKNIYLNTTDKITDVVDKINKEFSDGSLKASFSEMTNKFTIEGSKTGLDQEINLLENEFFSKVGISTGKVFGTNNSIDIYSSDGTEPPLRTIKQGSNIFTIDNVTYNVTGVTTDDKMTSITSQKDTTSATNKVKSFLDDYNKIIDNIYGKITQKKNRDYEPLTDSQKEDMDEKEIEKWEQKAKEGILKNDNELRRFMSDMQEAVTGIIGDTGFSLSDIGITSDSDYNKQSQLQLNIEKFTKALEEKGDIVNKVASKALENIKEVTFKYAGSSSSIFLKKAGMEKTSTAINNLFSEQIKKQEEQIKLLTTKMSEKEEALYKKFAKLESSMNKLNSQMSYLTGITGS